MVNNVYVLFEYAGFQTDEVLQEVLYYKNVMNDFKTSTFYTYTILQQCFLSNIHYTVDLLL